MRLFIYYIKFDSTKEPIGKFNAINLEDARLIASHIKQLPLKDFLEIFEVKELK
jgi:hypothetical protein